jgi:transcriptional regulator with XRE-family HTH domain
VTPAELILWRQRQNLNMTQAAAALGLHPNTISNYEAGRSEVPRYVALACAAVACGLKPWPWQEGEA